MGRTAKVTISLPRDLIAFADEVAREKKITRSKVFSVCLQELAEKRRTAEMAEGYGVLAREMKRFADTASRTEGEVVPEWR